MLTDIEIAKNCKLKNIKQIAEKIGISEEEIEYYGKFKAKINVKKNLKAKLILVTAINPTASGEGKTTVSIGLADGINKLNKKVCLALREPSLGPVFGLKGGAAGGGYAQVVPMEDINLHFTGDMHAITTANNLLCAMIDNHIFRGNELNIDTENIYFQRCMDMNDRALRNVSIGLNGEGAERNEHFAITAASEIMAILCLAVDLKDLKRRLGNIIVGLNKNSEYVFAKDLKADGAMATLLKDAIKPNLVQTLEGTPAIVHGGPFANIAHGCNSIIATYSAMSVAEYAVTEAGFGADLGAEKFLDCKCRVAGIQPDVIVIVATVKALKLHGGADVCNLKTENLVALKKGMPNLIKHIENMQKVYSKPVVVAINKFITDTDSEIELIKKEANAVGVNAIYTEVFAKGGEGGKELAKEVIKQCEQKSNLTYAYDLNSTIDKKISDIVVNVYGGNSVEFSEIASKKIKDLEKAGYDKLPIIIAKTQFSLSDDRKLISRPTGFKIFIRDIILKGGAEFVVAVAGNINLMPGLPKFPAAELIDVNECGEITGLF